MKTDFHAVLSLYQIHNIFKECEWKADGNQQGKMGGKMAKKKERSF